MFLWTQEELEVLHNAPDKDNIVLPNRSKVAIRKKLVSLGIINLVSNLWTQEELEVLHNAPDKNNIVLPNRSKRSIRKKLLELRIVSPIVCAWTQEEINVLVSAPDKNNIVLPNRTRKSIRMKLAELGIINLVYNVWTQEEFQILRDAPDKSNIVLPNRSEKAIRNKLLELKILFPTVHGAWTQEELRILSDAPDKNNIVLPNRSKKSIRMKLIKMNLVKSNKISLPRKRWTDEEIELIRNAHNPRKIKILGRSRYSVIAKVRQLGVVEKLPARRPWTFEEVALLKRLYQEGKNSPNKVLRTGLLKHTEKGIQIKMTQLGLNKAAAFSDANLKIKFKNFVRENWIGRTPQEITDLWNSHNEIKTNKNRVIRYLAVLNIQLPDGELERMVELRRKEKEIMKKSFNSSNQLNDAIRTVRAKFMEERIANNRDIWSGMPLTPQEML